MQHPIKTIILAMMLASSAHAVEKVSLGGRAGNTTTYFTKSHRVRHHRYELELSQKAKYSYTLSSVLAGRCRYDAALKDDRRASFRDVDDEVRDDEMFEADVRQAYLDWLTDFFAIKAGVMLIDWVDTLSPLVNDVLTPVDLRHGGFGDASELIVPVTAASLNHPFPGGSLEWLVIPRGKPSRLPKGDNGYGLIPLLEEKLEGAPYEFVEEKIPERVEEAEGGLRYLGKSGGLEWTLLAFHGHQRTPAVAVEVINEGELFKLHLTNPQQNTFGGSLAYAGDAWVLRGSAYHEPNRMPGFYVSVPPQPNIPSETRSRLGLGFDLVLSRHLKIYSEQFGTRTETDDGGKEDADPPPITKRDDYTAALRLTNETFSSVEFGLDYLVTSPAHGYVISPLAKFSLPADLKLSVGARIIHSLEPKSPYEVLKNASHAYVALYSHFASGG